ncbi:hypothetical protein SAMN04244548_05277 [Paracoccus pantotrophus]|nr:hypothetical protein SAMN04244548_05277 [Paracoccus pantotrophus]
MGAKMFQIRRKSQSWYGESIGILILDAAYPCIPGNVGNASTYPFPVRYHQVEGASIDRLLNQADPALVAPFIEGARKLQAEGVKAITGACGFMALFQREVAAAVEISVLLSPLLQIPFIAHITGRPVGVITANASRLTPAHFAACGADPKVALHIAGMEDQPEFRSAILEEKGTLDSARIEEEIMTVAAGLVQRHPRIGAILLECLDLPPYAQAIQAVTGRPVFDFNSMIRHVERACVACRYQGAM